MRRNWRNEAQAAIDALKNAKYGDREAELRRLARQFNTKSDDPSQLRRGIAAHEFLERLRLSYPGECEDLQGIPLSIAELIARWHVTEPTQALAAARDWARGTATVQSIRDKMEASAPKGYKGLVGAAHERAYRASALEQVRVALQELTEAEILNPTKRQRDPISGVKFDFSFDISSPNGREKAAALVVGPYKNHNMYRDRCDEWVERAFALAWIFDRVMLALPKVADPKPEQRDAPNKIPDYLKTYKERIGMIIRAVNQRNKDTTQSCPRYPKVDVAYIYDPLDSSESDALAPFGS